MKAKNLSWLIKTGQTWKIWIFLGISGMELAPYGICVNTILPGPVGTGLWERVTTEDQKDFLRTHIPLGRVPRPEEVARLVCYLASDEAAYITGESIVLAGGLPGLAFKDL